MSKKVIFLSYRRDDSPGYVKSLEKELEQYFGTDSVFRDVKDIDGGTKWKQVIDENLQNAAVLLLIIGPRWDSIWRARVDDPVNYVEYELNYAKRLGVRVIPITLDGSTISPQTDLGNVSWIRENQQYDMSDKQGRWENDFQGLLALLEGVEGVKAVKTINHTDTKNQSVKKKTSLLVKAFAGIGFILVGLMFAGLFVPDEPTMVTPSKEPGTENPNQQPQVVETLNENLQIEYNDRINGTWQGKDGTLYIIKKIDDISFSIESPGYANGRGEFLDKMPNKVRIEMYGVGYGEFSISNTNDKTMGWIIDNNGQKVYDTMIKVSP